jgi:hypothetical protein
MAPNILIDASLSGKLRPGRLSLMVQLFGCGPEPDVAYLSWNSASIQESLRRVKMSDTRQAALDYSLLAKGEKFFG